MSDFNKLILTFYQPLHHTLTSDNLHAFGRRQQLLGMNVMYMPHEIPNISRHGEDSVETGSTDHFQQKNTFCSWVLSGHLATAKETENFPWELQMWVHTAFVASQVVDVSWDLDIVTIFAGFIATQGWHTWKMHPEFHPWHCNISCLCHALDAIREVLKHTLMCKICKLAHLLKSFGFWTAKPITVQGKYYRWGFFNTEF